MQKQVKDLKPGDTVNVRYKYRGKHYTKNCVQYRGELDSGQLRFDLNNWASDVLFIYEFQVLNIEFLY